MRRTRSEPGAAAVLFACSGGAAVAVAIANVASLALARDVARLRDLRPLAGLRTDLDTLGIRLLTALPGIVNAAFDLHTVASVLKFSTLAVLVYLALTWMLAGLAAPLVVPLARRRAPAGESWPRGFPLAILAAGLVPIVTHRLNIWFTTAGSLPIALAGVGAAVAAWGLAIALVRSHGAARRLVTVCRLLALTGGALAVLGALGTAATASRHDGDGRPMPPLGAPNILLVSIDTLRPDHLGSYGYRRDTSPVIDALAASGVRFTTAVSPTSWTLPAHVTLLTALPPEIHGVVEDRFRLGEGVQTLAEVLLHQGYATAGFVSGPYLDAGYGFGRGFDLYDDYSAVRVSPWAMHRAHTSPALFDAVDRFLERWGTHTSRRPFFVFVHMWDVHYDFNPPPPYDTMFDPEYRGSITTEDFETGSAVHAGMDARDLEHVVALYDGEIRYTDAYLGRIVDAVRSLHVLDDTIVVVTSDHGEEFYEHGEKGHHKTLYDESIRVPLIVRYPPKVAAGTVVEAQVRLLDVAPTILALAGVAAPPTFGVGEPFAAYAGHDLSPLLSPAGVRAMPDLPAFAGLEPHGIAAVRTNGHKLMTGVLTGLSDRLFDLKADPGERHDLSTEDAATTDALRREIVTWHRTAQTAAKRTSAATVSEEHKAALRALGYIQ